MSRYKQPQVVIPCSKCGDTQRLNPFDIEEGVEIKCPRCEQLFLPSEALMEGLKEIKEAIIKELEDKA